jgi:hypothetical protein
MKKQTIVLNNSSTGIELLDFGCYQEVCGGICDCYCNVPDAWNKLQDTWHAYPHAASNGYAYDDSEVRYGKFIQTVSGLDECRGLCYPNTMQSCMTCLFGCCTPHTFGTFINVRLPPPR